MKVRNIIVAAGVIGILFALQFLLMRDNRDLRAESRSNFEELEAELTSRLEGLEDELTSYFEGLEDELAEWASRTEARLDSLFEER